jgi:phosphoheptose isomerase
MMSDRAVVTMSDRRRGSVNFAGDDDTIPRTFLQARRRSSEKSRRNRISGHFGKSGDCTKPQQRRQGHHVRQRRISCRASHLAEELVGRFKKDRRPFPAICLTADSGTVTCIANDYGYESLFVRQIDAFAQSGDIAVGLTTSGKSENVNRALRAAHARGAVTIALTGDAGLQGAEADHVIAVPSSDSAIIQEVHLMIIHIFCQAVEDIA